jgi:signal peptidase
MATVTSTRRPAPLRLISMIAGGAGRLVLLLACLAIAATFLPSLAGYERYVLEGGSMEPTIHRGSLVFDEVVPVAQLRRGDVITYVPAGGVRPVTHRIIELSAQPNGRRVVHTKGDANPTADLRPYELGGTHQARVSFSVPYLGWMFMALDNPRARMYLLALPALAIALSMLAGAWREGGRLVREGQRPANGSSTAA